jgi:Protein of unknown function (DUF2849)
MEVITANSLADGRVVFQTTSGWTHELGRAQILDTPELVAAALLRANADAAANRVVEPYAIEVKHGPGGLTATRLRERIRADGPTTGNSRPKDGAAQDEAA